ncbi:MAG: extracellular solute-binding protein [Treponema sp.]|nr:extracellular solute-binding protein [Treponema sp.]
MAKIKLNKTLRNVLIAVVVIVGIFAISSLFPDKDFSAKYEGYDLSAASGTVNANLSYNDYIARYRNAKNASSSAEIAIFDYDAADSYGVRVETGFHGKDVVITEDRSSVTWNVEVPEEGFYNVLMEYMAVPSRNVNMERVLYINGETFSGADTLSFNRLWHDSEEIRLDEKGNWIVRKDNQGNWIRPSQVEFFEYQTVRFKSDLGYEVEPYRFYFKKGTNTIKFVSTNEPMAISRFALVPVLTYDTYEQYLAKQPSKPESYTGSGVKLQIEGEMASSRSDPSLFARYDRSSATTNPYDVKHTILNYTGGDSWKAPGQWIEWDMDIPETGWYTISFKGRQLYQRGFIACRSVYIDGVIPIDGLKSVGFDYSSDWELVTLAGEDKTPYKFYLTKGVHTIRLEATLGEIGSIINELQDSISRLNKIYRTILVLTGTYPDAYRDYDIDKVYPDEVEGMMLESRRLYALIDRFVGITGEKSDKIAPAETLAVQLEQFYKRPDKITKAFANFKSNITSLGSSLLSMTETKLDIDYILVQSANDKIKSVKANFFKKAGHSIVSFFTSFFVDSTNLGNVYDEKGGDKPIEVWIVTGRDQSQIIKNMVDDDFIPKTGVKVNVKLININSLLNAVVAGNGPDVVISIYSSAPVDYALRNANVNLSRFPDLDEVLSEFKPSAYEAYKYDGGVYALPEQESFNLLFYRKDIMDQLELEIPQTWEELVEILPTIQGNNLQVGIPYPNIVTPDMTTYYSMVYQNGGQVYNEKGTKSVIDSEEGIAAFKDYTSFFNNYSLDTIYDFLSRFRTGEMPLGIANYTTYNTLSVSAPEIRGLWDFTYILGTEREDGTINRSTIAGTVGTMMIKKGIALEDLGLSNASELIHAVSNGKEIERDPSVDQRTWKKAMKNERRIQDSWKFMKWWASSDVQVRFGREIEAVLGSSARYPTANVEALKQLPWNSRQIEILENSLEDSIGVPEVPGSYYTPRHIVNGTRKVINDKDDARETLIDYTRKINEELTRKRQEFNLPVEE